MAYRCPFTPVRSSIVPTSSQCSGKAGVGGAKAFGAGCGGEGAWRTAESMVVVGLGRPSARRSAAHCSPAREAGSTGAAPCGRAAGTVAFATTTAAAQAPRKYDERDGMRAILAGIGAGGVTGGA